MGGVCSTDSVRDPIASAVAVAAGGSGLTSEGEQACSYMSYAEVTKVLFAQCQLANSH